MLPDSAKLIYPGGRGASLYIAVGAQKKSKDKKSTIDHDVLKRRSEDDVEDKIKSG